VSSRNPVLVALDGTPVAERAIPPAVALAHRWKAPLRLVHVRNPVKDVHKMDLRLIDNGKSLSVHSRSGIYLDSLAESLSDSQNLSVRAQTVTGVSIANTLRSMCENDVRTLVMVRPRRSALSRFWSGSVTNSLIGGLSVPLVLVPAESNWVHKQDTATFYGLNRVLVYLDGTEASDAVLDQAIAVASEDTVYHLVRVLPMSSLYAAHGGGLSRSASLRNDAWLGLSKAADKLEELRLECKSQLIFDAQNPGSAIVDHAKATHAQLVVVAARQHLLPRWLTDDVVDYVVCHASVPVLVVPADGSVVSYTKANHVDIHSN
jgi:nucleotide-binding universal stress UspA family protein